MSNANTQKERRVGQVAVPENIKSILTDMQHQALARLEGFGWSIAFVRRPIFQNDVVVLFDQSGKRHAILNEDGSLDTTTDLQVR